MYLSSYLRNAEHLRIENEQRHLFEVNSVDHKDDVRPELRKNGIVLVLIRVIVNLSKQTLGYSNITVLLLVISKNKKCTKVTNYHLHIGNIDSDKYIHINIPLPTENGGGIANIHKNKY